MLLVSSSCDHAWDSRLPLLRSAVWTSGRSLKKRFTTSSGILQVTSCLQIQLLPH